MTDHAPLVGHGAATSSREVPRVPKVVIFDRPGSGAKVEVVRVNSSTGLGGSIRRFGTRWRVTEMRTHDRVLICRPART